jgi:hypothetical protein
MAPKNSVAARDVGEVGEFEADMSDDDCDPTVSVRIGATAWKFDCEVIIYEVLFVRWKANFMKQKVRH